MKWEKEKRKQKIPCYVILTCSDCWRKLWLILCRYFLWGRKNQYHSCFFTRKKKEQIGTVEEGTDKNSIALSSGGTLFSTKGKNF